MSEGVVSLSGLTAFQRDALWTLTDAPRLTGPDVERRLEEYYGEAIDRAAVHTALGDLVEYGLVEQERADGRANAYRLTEAGRRALSARQAWLGGGVE